MKTQTGFMQILRLSVTLLLITAFVGAALAGVNYITKDIIAQINAEKTQRAIEAVLEGGGEAVPFNDETGLVTAVYQGVNGYAVQVAPSGFDGTIDMMVGISNDGTVTGISIISHTETAGLGAVAAASSSAGESFRGQFEGLSGELAVTKDGGTIEAITGATITSRAVTKGVNAALACVEGLQ